MHFSPSKMYVFEILPNFGGLVLGFVKADFCEYVYILQHVEFSYQLCTHLHVCVCVCVCRDFLGVFPGLFPLYIPNFAPPQIRKITNTI